MQSSVSTSLQCSRNSNCTDLYIYDIPSINRRNLCMILDDLNVWSDLAIKHMGYNQVELQQIVKRANNMGNSPTDELLHMWGDHNHTVTELFVLLYRMQLYSAMDTIKLFVEPKYHKLITRSQPALSVLMQSQDTNTQSSHKLLNRNLDVSMVSNSNNESSSSISNNTANDGSTDLRYANEYASTIPQINYNELAEATNNWNDKQILGKGGFGTVYKGVWKNTSVAIKRIEYHGTLAADVNKVQIQQSLNELRYLNSCRHDNILPLYGFSINGEEPCLVYQLMAGGSLEQRLNTKKLMPLTWNQRLNIARGTARGLQYLHTFREKPLIHGDIKPANILLDPCNQPKIGDFGLAREGPNALNSSLEVSRVYGTKPYLPVEFLAYKTLSTKVDTYSFGIVLLELATGLRAYDKMRQHTFLAKHIHTMLAENVTIEALIDKTLAIESDSLEICKTFINLGKICIAEKPEQRPEMVMVLRHLDKE